MTKKEIQESNTYVCLIAIMIGLSSVIAWMLYCAVNEI